MATDEKTTPDQGTDRDSVCFAELPQGLAVVKIIGRGTFANSVELKKLGENLTERVPKGRIIVDLEECTTMDSTFMGVLASVGLRQKRDAGEKMTVVNANPQNVRLLQTLGLSHFMNVRSQVAEDAQAAPEDFKCATPEELSRYDRIVHMIEAHQTLCDADSQNELRFQSVLKYLGESLHKEETKH